MAHTPAFEFLKRRYASAIERADNRTATRLRAELNRLLNEPAPRARADRDADATVERSVGPAQARPAYDYDDILGPHL